MADKYSVTSTFKKLLDIIRTERAELSQIYFFAVLGGIIQLSLPIGVQSVINFVLGGAISTSLIILIAMVLLGVFLGGWVQISQMRIIEKVQQKLFTRYSFALASIMPATDEEYTDAIHLPEQANRFFETLFIQKSIRKILLDLPAASIQILLGIILLSFYHPAFLLFGAMLLAMLFFTLNFTLSAGLKASVDESTHKYDVAGWLQELGRAQFVFRMNPDSKLYYQKTDKAVVGYLKGRTQHFKILMLQFKTLVAFKIIITAALLIVGSVLLVQNKLNIGQFIAAEIIILFVIGSVEKIISGMDVVFDVLTSVQKITEVIHLPKEKNGSMQMQAPDQGIEIQFNDVSYTYPNGSTCINQLNVSIPARARVLVSGAPMAGKSTLLKLLTGAYPSYSGSISLAGIPMRNLDLGSLRKHVGLLHQEAGIFRGTLLENLSLGNPNINITQITEHLKAAGLDSLVYALPKGLEEMLSPENKKISQRNLQKLLVVRLILSGSPILLLDEPLTLLDPKDRQQMVEYIMRYSTNATLLITGDEPELVSHCDYVLVLDENGSGKLMGKDEFSIQKNIK